ncbi:MAG: aminopeptidase P family protein, partial [Sulfolobus sp.]|nr:aminopeptidase P family protein [Sulfolobus sp.]
MSRIKKLKEILEDKKLDCAVISGEPNLYYFLGYRGTGILILCDDTPTLLSSTLEKYRAETVKDAEVKIYDPIRILEDDKNTIHADYRDAIKTLIGSNKRTGADLNWMSYGDYLYFKENFNVEDLSAQILELRGVKDQEELELIKKAGEITTTAFKKTLDNLKENMSEKEVAGYLEYLFRKLGAEDYAFPSIIA